MRRHCYQVHGIFVESKVKDNGPTKSEADDLEMFLSDQGYASMDNVLTTPLLEQDNTPYGCAQKKYICDICRRSFSTKFNLSRHKKKHLDRDHATTTSTSIVPPYFDEIVTHTCTVCKHGFKKKFNLTRHMKKHCVVQPADKQYTCQICHKSFAERVMLEQHGLTHIDKGWFECTVCANRYKKQLSLDQHIQADHHHHQHLT